MSHLRSTRPLLAVAGTAALLVSLSACGGNSDAASDSGGNGGTNQSADTGGSGGSGSSDGGAGGAGGQMPGTSGTIAAIDGKTLQVQNEQSGQVAVTYGGSTDITAQVSGSLDDVSVGSCVRVTGSGTPVAATSVVVTAKVDGSCSGGFGGRGDSGGPGGTPPSGAPTDLPTDMPTDVPTDGQGGPGGGGDFAGAFGEVSAVTDAGFTVQSTMPGAPGASDDDAKTTEVEVTTSSDTTFTTTQDADASALKVGKCVLATGDADDAGAVTATSLRVSDPVDGSCSTGFGFGGRGPGGGTGDQDGSTS